MYTTNYFDTFIAVAEDCPALTAEIPEPRNDKPTVASMQYEMISKAPYRHTSDDVIFTVSADRAGIPKTERKKARDVFFSKPQPCLRSSSLGKRYGWGLHSDSKGRIALFGVESRDYARLVSDPTVKQTKALRTKRG